MTKQEATEKMEAMKLEGSWDNLPIDQLKKKIADWNYVHGFIDGLKTLDVEAIKNVKQGARFYLNRKYGDRKRLDLNETFEKATLIRDIDILERFILSL